VVVVMSIHKLTTGDGYSYLTRHVAGGDVDRVRGQDAADYYTAEGNPPGVWIGRGAQLLDLTGQQVSEEQMQALFRDGMHPDARRIITEYLAAHLTDGMDERQQDRVRAAAVREAMLGRAYPRYEPLPPFAERVTARLGELRRLTGREPTAAERKKIQAEEAKRPRSAVAGFDLVFAPVKSAALLWALHPDTRVQDAVTAAHRTAMTAALDLLEEHAAFTRTGAGGVAQIDTHGLVAAAFDHYDSRDGDPNLHTHVVVANKVLGVDGRWRALDARGLYRMTVAVSETYNSVFQAALTESLGVAWVDRRPGRAAEPVWEIDGIPPELIDRFSQRATALVACYEQLVAAYREEHGHDPPAPAAHALRRQATLATRQGKKQPRSLAAMRGDWARHAGAAAIEDVIRAVADPAVSVRVVRDGPGPSRTAVPGGPAVPDGQVIGRDRPGPGPDRSRRELTPERVEELAAAVAAGVAQRRATWTVWNLRAEAERLLRANAARVGIDSVAAHSAAVDAVVAAAAGPGHSICIEAPTLVAEPVELRRRRYGESVFVEHGAARYTSRAILDAEHRLLTAARTIPTRVGSSVPLPSREAVNVAVRGFEESDGAALDEGQRGLVAAFLTDPRLLVVGLGPAGTGKTTAMRAYHHALTTLTRDLDGGRARLVPLATSAASAAVLARELGVQAENLHKFLHEHTHGPHADALAAGGPVPASHQLFQLQAGNVVLVDEAGMAGTLNLDRLVTIATAHGARVRLLGDYRQLAAVESGGALRLIATEVGAAHLSTVHRFLDPAQAEATLQLRTGDPAGLDYYDERGRVVGGSTSAMIEAAYRGWWGDVQAGRTSFMPAATNALVAQLSARARADRVTAGQVEPDGVCLHDGNIAGVGDWVVTRANRRTLAMHGGRDWVRNGDAWRVLGRHPDGSLQVEHLGHAGRIVLPADYVARDVELLYATTAHRVQGGTVDTAHPLITPGMSREHLYVAATRARARTTLYVATHDVLPVDEDERVDRARWDPAARTAREVLHEILGREGAELSATETIREHQAAAESLATLIPRYQHAVAVLARKDPGDTDDADDADHPDAGAKAGREAAVPLARPGAGDISRYLGLIAHVLPGGIDLHSGRRVRLAAAYTVPDEPRPDVVGVPGDDPTRAWQLLAWTVKGHETHGGHAGDLLAGTETARSLHAVLHIAHHRAQAAADVHHRNTSPGLPPWTPAPPPRVGDDLSATAHVYLTDAAEQIRGRVRHLTDVAVQHRPAWTDALGDPLAGPDAKPDAERAWREQVGVVAAYREQHHVADDDPHHPLGPYVPPEHPGHGPYWHAAAAIVTARSLTHPTPQAGDTGRRDRPTPLGHTPDDDGDRDAHQAAADAYTSLPQPERDAILTAMVATTGNLWPGRSGDPDAAAIDPAHARQLADALTRRGHLTDPAQQPANQQRRRLAGAREPGPPYGVERTRRRAAQPHQPDQPSPAPGPADWAGSAWAATAATTSRAAATSTSRPVVRSVIRRATPESAPHFGSQSGHGDRFRLSRTPMGVKGQATFSAKGLPNPGPEPALPGASETHPRVTGTPPGPAAGTKGTPPCTISKHHRPGPPTPSARSG
jgi:conjugative relaxase-like TrwC/TraI family protein